MNAPGAPPAAPKLTRPPRVKVPPAPVYPPAALATGLSGEVRLQLDVSAEGRVSAARVLAGAGHGFDEAALAAVDTMELEPAEIDGKPGAIRIEYVVRFRPPADAGADAGVAPTADAGLAPDARAKVDVAPPPLVARGRALERGTRDPIAGADVTLLLLDGASAGAAAGAGLPDAGPPALRAEAALPVAELVATTDESGAFGIRAPPSRRARILVASGEHEPCLFEVTLPAASAAPLELECRPLRRRSSYESVVRAPSEGRDVTRHAIAQPEMRSVPGTFGDPLRVVQLMPGMTRIPYGAGLLIIRGSSPADSGVYVDGHRVPLLYHFLGGPSILTPGSLERIEYSPGGFGVRYGRATAGIIDVVTRQDPVKRAHGEADVDVPLDSSIYGEAPLGRGFSGSVGARRSYADTILPLVLPLVAPRREGSTTVVVTPVYWDYQVRVSKDVGGGRLSLFAFGSSDSLAVVAQDPNRGDLDLGTRIGLHRVIGTWSQTLGAWTSRLSPSYGYDMVTFSAGQASGSFSAHVFGLREELQRPLGESLRLVLGVDNELRLDGLEFDVPLPLDRPTYGRSMRVDRSVARTLTDLGAAAYVELPWDITRGLRLTPGLRADWFHYNEVGRTSLDPRAVVRWQVNDLQAWKLGAGVYHQAPMPQQLDKQFGNPSLPLIWADQYHLGFERRFLRVLSLDATAYFLRRHSMPIASSRLTPAGRPEAWTPAGVGRSYGLELHLKHQITERFFGWISYTLARSEAIQTLAHDLMAPAPAYSPTEFDQTHNLIFVASRKLGAWELGTRFRLVTGLPETPIRSATYDADYDMHQPERGAPFSARRATFHQLDLRAERTWTFPGWQLSAYLDVQNVYNAENPEATLNDYRFRQSAPVRGLPILPTLGVRGRL